MKLTCTSINCPYEKPEEDCKKCSHAEWAINKYVTFSPHFGYKIDYDALENWPNKLNRVDIKKCSFKIIK